MGQRKPNLYIPFVKCGECFKESATSTLEMDKTADNAGKQHADPCRGVQGLSALGRK